MGKLLNKVIAAAALAPLLAVMAAYGISVAVVGIALTGAAFAVGGFVAGIPCLLIVLRSIFGEDGFLGAWYWDVFRK